MIVDTHHVPIKVFSSLKIKFIDGIRFLDPENLFFDTSLTSLYGILTVLDDCPSFDIMADAHYAPIKGFYLLYMTSDVRR